MMEVRDEVIVTIGYIRRKTEFIYVSAIGDVAPCTLSSPLGVLTTFTFISHARRYRAAEDATTCRITQLS